jgi:hypothetical protein
MNRQAATPKGLERRINDLRFSQVPDPRMESKVTHMLPAMLTTLTAGMVTNARSLRSVEQRSGEIAMKHGVWQGVKERIADNTLGRLLPRLRLVALVACLHRLIKAEQRRGNLKPTVLPIPTVAIDGKNVGTLHWDDLCRVLFLEPEKATVAKVRAKLAQRYPEAQLCIPKEGEPYALVRVHTVTLISADAAPCIHQRPIEGDTNEVGAMPRLIDELCAAYCRTKLFRLVTTDAGNTSLGSAKRLVEQGLGYFAQIKSIHGELHAEAVRRLGDRRPSRAPQSYADQQNGKTVTYYAWSCDLSEQGWLDWTHARQLVRIRRVVQDPDTGKVLSTGDRYYVTSTLALRELHALERGRRVAGGPPPARLVPPPTRRPGCLSAPAHRPGDPGRGAAQKSRWLQSGHAHLGSGDAALPAGAVRQHPGHDGLRRSLSKPAPASTRLQHAFISSRPAWGYGGAAP